MSYWFLDSELSTCSVLMYVLIWVLILKDCMGGHEKLITSKEETVVFKCL